jgi:hypothetical protein
VPILGSTQVNESIVVPANQPSGSYRSRQVTEAALDVTDETSSGSAQPDPDSSLRIHYDFDDPPGDSTISDSSRHIGDATCSGAACPAMGIRGAVNRAALFDGNDMVSVLADSTLNSSSSAYYTVAASVKARDGMIFEDWNGYQPFRVMTDRYDYGSSGGSNGDQYGQGYKKSATSELPSATQWTHVVITFKCAAQGQHRRPALPRRADGCRQHHACGALQRQARRALYR